MQALKTDKKIQACFPMTAYSKSNVSLFSLYYAIACNNLAEPITASLRLGNTAPIEEILLQYRIVDNTVSDLLGPRFEPQISCSKDECLTTRPTGR